MTHLEQEIEGLIKEEAKEEKPAPAQQPVVPAVPELTQPVIDHAAAIAAIQERQAKHVEDMAREMSGLEERIVAAQAAGNQQLEERLNARLAALEARAERVAQEAAKAVEEPPEEVEELAEDEIEVPRVAPEKRKGLRARRKARRNR